MKFNRQFYVCKKCGNMVGMIENSGVSIICCGEEMSLLSPNTTDAAEEKHVPVVAGREGCMATVSVGSAAHPMTKEHHIAWIVVAQAGRTQRATLDPEGVPQAVFCLEDGPATVYAYCNLHGLWAVDI